VFIDETWAKTNMTRRHGRCSRGTRLVAKVPQGRWRTLTFVAALRHDRARLEDERKVADLRNRHDSLTAREREVMALLVSGRVNKQIAAEAGISEVTVRLHRGQIMRKMHASSLADLIRIADKIKS